MNRIVLFFSIIVLFSASMTFAEDIDVVYLKNGSVIRGKIIEQVINESIKIELQDGSIIVFEYEQIEKIGVIEAPSTKGVTGTKIKSPGTALALSLCPPILLPIQGIGQFYNGESGKGAGFLITGLVSGCMMLYGLQETTTSYSDFSGSYEETEYENEGAGMLGGFIYIGLWIWSSIDAYSSAKRINQTLASKEDYGFAISFLPNKINLSYRF